MTAARIIAFFVAFAFGLILVPFCVAGVLYGIAEVGFLSGRSTARDAIKEIFG